MSTLSTAEIELRTPHGLASSGLTPDDHLRNVSGPSIFANCEQQSQLPAICVDLRHDIFIPGIRRPFLRSSPFRIDPARRITTIKPDGRWVAQAQFAAALIGRPERCGVTPWKKRCSHFVRECSHSESTEFKHSAQDQLCAPPAMFYYPCSRGIRDFASIGKVHGSVELFETAVLRPSNSRRFPERSSRANQTSPFDADFTAPQTSDRALNLVEEPIRHREIEAVYVCPTEYRWEGVPRSQP